MRKLIPLALLAFLLSGCLESEEAFVLEADGSGTVHQSYTVDLRARLELAQLAAVLYGGSLAAEDLPFANPVAPRWIEALARRTPGYELKSAKETEKDGKRTSVVEARFESLEAAAQGGAFFASAVSLEAVDDTTWKLTLRDAWKGVSTRRADELGGYDVAALVKGFKSQLEGLVLRRTFRLPTRVLSTNGELDEAGTRVTWSVDYAALSEGKDLVLTITFQNEEGLRLKPFRYKPDLRALMVRCLEAPPGATTATEATADEDGDASAAAPEEPAATDGSAESAPTEGTR